MCSILILASRNEQLPLVFNALTFIILRKTVFRKLNCTLTPLATKKVQQNRKKCFILSSFYQKGIQFKKKKKMPNNKISKCICGNGNVYLLIHV